MYVKLSATLGRVPFTSKSRPKQTARAESSVLMLVIRRIWCRAEAATRMRRNFQGTEEYGECRAICRQPGYRQEACLP